MQKYFDVVQAGSGAAIPGALITVTVASTGQPAALYSDNAGGALANPVTADASGEYSFYAANGLYTLTITAAGFTSESKANVLLDDPADVETSVVPFGPAGDGVTDDTAELQLALNTGKLVRLSPGKSYLISSTLIVPIGGGGFIAELDATIILANASFTNAAKATRHGVTACGILIAGLTASPYTVGSGGTVRGVKIRMQTPVNGRVIVPIAARNAKDVQIVGNDLTGFGGGTLVALDSVVGNSRVQDNYLHDCTENGNAFSDGTVQLTGVEVDQFRVNSVPSQGIAIHDNTIVGLTFGAAAFTAYGYQTDGININGSGSYRHNIHNNIIRNVGEGIDCFGQECVIANNVITETYLFGVKLIHGAVNNVISGNQIRTFGIAGVMLSSSVNGGASNNLVSGNTVLDATPTAAQIASEDVACIKTYDPSSGVNLQPANNSILNNHCDIGSSGGEYGIYRGSYGSGNVFKGNHLVRAGTVGWYGDRGTETGGVYGFKDANPTAVSLYMSGAQTVVAGAGQTKVTFDATSFDARAESVSASNRVLIQSAGVYRVGIRLRSGTAAALSTYNVRIRKNNVETVKFEWRSTSSSSLAFVGSTALKLVAGDYLEVFIDNASGTDLVMTTGADFSEFTVEQV